MARSTRQRAFATMEDLAHHPPHRGRLVTVAGKVGRYVGFAAGRHWLVWSAAKTPFQLMAATLDAVLARLDQGRPALLAKL